MRNMRKIDNKCGGECRIEIEMCESTHSDRRKSELLRRIAAERERENVVAIARELLPG